MEQNNLETAATAKREPKHFAIVGAIRDFQQTINKMDSLIMDLEGPQPSPQDKLSNAPEAQPPPLAEFLNATPEQLSLIQNEISTRINRIRELTL